MDKKSPELRFPPEHIVRRRSQKAKGKRSKDLITKLSDATEEREWMESLERLEEKGLIPKRTEELNIEKNKQPEE